MAKQRGIHQISGKVNNLCYYEQKYVRGGLIRRINEAMSLRLKQDPIFERTREVNSVFGMCSMLASTFFEAFGYGLKEMYIPSVQARFTRALLRIFKSQRNHEYGDTIAGDVVNLRSMAIAFNGFGRNHNLPLSSFFSPFYTDLAETDTGYRKVVIPRGVLKNYLSKYGAVRLQYRVIHYFDILSPVFSSETGKYTKSGYIRRGLEQHNYWNISDDDLEIIIEAPGGLLDYNFVLVVMYPIVPTGDGLTDRFDRGAFYYLIAHDQ